MMGLRTVARARGSSPGLTTKAGWSRLFGVRRPEPPLWYRAAW